MKVSKILTVSVLLLTLWGTLMAHDTQQEISGFGKFMMDHLGSVRQTRINSVSETQQDGHHVHQAKHKSGGYNHGGHKEQSNRQKLSHVAFEQNSATSHNKGLIPSEIAGAIHLVLRFRQLEDLRQIKKEKNMTPEERSKSETQRREEQLAHIRRLLKMTNQERIEDIRAQIIRNFELEKEMLKKMTHKQGAAYKKEKHDLEEEIRERNQGIIYADKNAAMEGYSPKKFQSFLQKEMEERKIFLDLFNILQREVNK